MSAKDPKGRKAGGGKAGGKAGAGERAHSCGMTGDALQRGFDGEGGAQDVASHVAGCDPCGSALELLQTQRDAVLFLTASAVVKPAHTAVEQILSSTARAGRAKLADLLYEMAKACLIVLPDLKRRIERKVEPREVPVVASELQSINSRLELTDGSIALRDVPHQTPEEARALKVARSCLAILDNVEGASERQQLAWSQVLIFEGKPAEAERVLRSLIDRDVSPENRHHVLRNTTMSLNAQKRFTESVEFAQHALTLCPNDCVLLYNLSVALASLADAHRFKAVSSRFAELVPEQVPEWLRRLISFEAANFSDKLGMSQVDVVRCFGLESASGARP
jgi:tetratricopeptide (TPR) repeat protein